MTDLPCENCGLTDDTGCRCWEPQGDRRWARIACGAVVVLWVVVLMGIVAMEVTR